MVKKYISGVRAVAIAGGEGRRLRPFTNEQPKALLPVGTEKKPMLEFSMQPWLKLGIGKYVFCTGYMSDMIERYFGDGSKFGINIDYSVEDARLETGGAIKRAVENEILSKDQPIIVFYCDDFVRLDPRELIKSHMVGVEKHGFKATLVATDTFRTDYGIVKAEDVDNKLKRVVGFKEKPLIKRSANVGIYCLEPEILEMLDNFQSPFKFEKVVIPELVERGLLMVFEIPWENWIPVNTDKDYEKILNISMTDFYSKVL